MASFFKDLFAPRPPTHARSTNDSARDELARLRQIPLRNYQAKLRSKDNTRKPGADGATPPRKQVVEDELIRQYNTLTASQLGGRFNTDKDALAISGVNRVGADEETLGRLDTGYFTQDFDPMVNLLQTLPESKEQLDFYLLEQVGYYDRITDVVNLKLSEAVQGNYTALVSGVKQVQHIDLDITRAAIHARNSRRMLAAARKLLVDGNLAVLRLHRQRERARDALNRVSGLAQAVTEKDRVVAMRAGGQLCQAVTSAAKLLNSLNAQGLGAYKVIQAVEDQVFDQFDLIRQEADQILHKICTAGEMDCQVLSHVVNVYLLLDQYYSGPGKALARKVTGGASLTLGIGEKIGVTFNVIITKVVRDTLLEKFVQRPKKEQQELSFAQASQSSIDVLVQKLPTSGKPSTYHIVLRIYENLVEVLRSFSQIEHWFHQFSTGADAAEVSDITFTWLCLSSETRDKDGESRDQTIKEWKTLLEQVHSTLLEHKAQVWATLQSKLVQLLSSPALGMYGTKIPQLQLVVSSTATVASLGQAFGGQQVLELRAKLRQYVASYTLEYHESCMDALTNFLRRESWGRICVSIERLGGPTALLNRGRAKQLRRTSTESVAKEIAADRNGGAGLSSEQLSIVDGQSHNAENPITQLLDRLCLSSSGGRRQDVVASSAHKSEMQVPNKENDDDTKTNEEYEDEEGTQTDLGESSDGTQSSGEENDNEELGETNNASLDHRVVTSTLVNCIPGCITKYLRLMETVPMSAGDAITYLQRLCDTYLLTIFSNMVPFAEASFVMDRTELPWPKQFAALSEYISRVASVLGAEPIKNKIAYLKGPMVLTAQKYNSSSISSPTHTKSGNGSKFPALSLRGSSTTGGEPWMYRIASARQTATKVPSRLIQLSDNNVRSLAARIVAAESLDFFTELIELGKQTVEFCCPAVQKESTMKHMFNALPIAAKQLRLLVLKGVGRELVEQSFQVDVTSSVTTSTPPSKTTTAANVLRGTGGSVSGAISRQLDRARRAGSKSTSSTAATSGASQAAEGSSTPQSFLASQVHGVRWGQMRSLQANHSEYVNVVVNIMRQLWSRIQRESEEGRTYPLSACGTIWEFCVEEVVEQLLDAYGSISVCSTEGRALMSMDFASIGRALDEIAPQGKFAIAARDRVDKYIKAYYYDREVDLLEWVKQHRTEFLPEHLLCLAECGVGANLNNRTKQDLFTKLGVLL